MRFDCIVTTPKFGWFKSKTGLLEEFIIEYTQGKIKRYYLETIIKHLVNCNKCDPKAALEFIIEQSLKNQPNDDIRSYIGDMAIAYEETFRKEGKLSKGMKEVVTECIKKSGEFDLLLFNAERFSSAELYEGFQVMVQMHQKKNILKNLIHSIRMKSMFERKIFPVELEYKLRAILFIYEKRGSFLPFNELEDFAPIYQIMNS